MRFLDSWVWLEYIFSGDAEEAAETAILDANSPDEGGIIGPTIVTEVFYRVRVVEDETIASEAIRAIRDYEHIESVPLIDDIAEYAAELRAKYYEPDVRELSYADAIHLATATVHEDCDVLYSGDPDFAAVDEIETVLL